MAEKRKKTKRGRPPIKDGSRKDVLVRLLMSATLHEKLEAAAKAEGTSTSAFIRGLIEDRIGPIDKGLDVQ